MPTPIDVLVPMLIAHDVNCNVSECSKNHERVVDLSAYSDGTLLYLCRKHYEDFVHAAKTLP